MNNECAKTRAGSRYRHRNQRAANRPNEPTRKANQSGIKSITKWFLCKWVNRTIRYISLFRNELQFASGILYQSSFFSIFLPIPSSVNSHSRPKVFPFPDFFFRGGWLFVATFFFRWVFISKAPLGLFISSRWTIGQSKKKGDTYLQLKRRRVSREKNKFLFGGSRGYDWLGLAGWGYLFAFFKWQNLSTQTESPPSSQSWLCRATKCQRRTV